MEKKKGVIGGMGRRRKWEKSNERESDETKEERV